MPTAPKSTHAGVCDVAVPVPADTALTSATCSCVLLHAVRQPFKWPPVLREAGGGARDTARTWGTPYGAAKKPIGVSGVDLQTPQDARECPNSRRWLRLRTGSRNSGDFHLTNNHYDESVRHRLAISQTFCSLLCSFAWPPSSALSSSACRHRRHRLVVGC